MRTTMMTNERATATHVRALLAAGLLMLVALLPRGLAAETEEAGLKDCVDKEWADYNDCLMESGMEWEKKLCDYYFEAGFTLCNVKYFGEARKAASGAN